ncbi:hypothetical protein QTO34_004508, partial [Cnephaeus nilssonii]
MDKQINCFIEMKSTSRLRCCEDSSNDNKIIRILHKLSTIKHRLKLEDLLKVIQLPIPNPPQAFTPTLSVSIALDGGQMVVMQVRLPLVWSRPDPGARLHPDPGAHGLTRTRDPVSLGSRGTQPRPDPGFSFIRTQGRMASPGPRGAWPLPDPGSRGLTRTQGRVASPRPRVAWPHPDPGAHGLTRTRDPVSPGSRGPRPHPDPGPGSPGSRGPGPHPDPGPSLTRIQGPRASPGPGARLTRIQGPRASPGPGARLTRIQGPRASPGPGTQAHLDPGAQGLARTRGQAHPGPGAQGLARTRGQAHPDPGAQGLARTRGQAHPDPGAQGLARTRDPGSPGSRGPGPRPDPGPRLTRIQGPRASPGPGTQAHPDPGAQGLARTRDPGSPGSRGPGPRPDPGPRLTRIQGPRASPGPGTQAHPDPGAQGLARTRDPGSPGSRGPGPRPDPGPRLTRIQGPRASPGPGTQAHPDPGAQGLARIQGPRASPGPGTQAHPDPGAQGLARTRDPGSPGSRGPGPRPDPGPRLTRIQGPRASPGSRGPGPRPDPGPRLTRIQGPRASPGPGTHAHPDPGAQGLARTRDFFFFFLVKKTLRRIRLLRKTRCHLGDCSTKFKASLGSSPPLPLNSPQSRPPPAPPHELQLKFANQRNPSVFCKQKRSMLYCETLKGAGEPDLGLLGPSRKLRHGRFRVRVNQIQGCQGPSSKVWHQFFVSSSFPLATRRSERLQPAPSATPRGTPIGRHSNQRVARGKLLLAENWCQQPRNRPPEFRHQRLPLAPWVLLQCWPFRLAPKRPALREDPWGRQKAQVAELGVADCVAAGTSFPPAPVFLWPPADRSTSSQRHRPPRIPPPAFGRRSDWQVARGNGARWPIKLAGGAPIHGWPEENWCWRKLVLAARLNLIHSLELQHRGSSWKGSRDMQGGTELSGIRTRAGGAAFIQREVVTEAIVPLQALPHQSQQAAGFKGPRPHPDPGPSLIRIQGHTASPRPRIQLHPDPGRMASPGPRARGLSRTRDPGHPIQGHGLTRTRNHLPT